MVDDGVVSPIICLNPADVLGLPPDGNDMTSEWLGNFLSYNLRFIGESSIKYII